MSPRKAAKQMQAAVVLCVCVCVVLQWCYNGVTMLLQWCCSGVAVVLQWCYTGVTVSPRKAAKQMQAAVVVCGVKVV
jgi:hypothetical protein